MRGICALILASIVSTAAAITEPRALTAQVADPGHIIVRNGRTSALQEQLQRAADRGYRVVPLVDDGSGALLEKATVDTEPVEYLVLSTSRTGTLKNEMNEASAHGYRFVSALAGLNIVMGRKKGATTRTHEYLVVATELRQTMEDELVGSAAVGFRVVGQSYGNTTTLRGTREFMAILERPLASDERTPTTYLLLDTVKASTRQRELQEAGARGYRLVPLQGRWESAALLEKTTADVEPFDYVVLSTGRSVTMWQEMDRASAEGYHFAAVLGSGGVSETVIAMERRKGTTSRTHEQRILRWSSLFSVLQGRSDEAERELLTELAKGFHLVGQAYFRSFLDKFWPTGGESVVILERRVQ